MEKYEPIIFSLIFILLFFIIPTIYLLKRFLIRRKFFRDNPSEYLKYKKKVEMQKKHSDPCGLKIYELITKFVFGLTFIISYIYCITNYGFLLGLGLGWLPSIILALIVMFVWPIILIAMLFILFF